MLQLAAVAYGGVIPLPGPAADHGFQREQKGNKMAKNSEKMLDPVDLVHDDLLQDDDILFDVQQEADDANAVSLSGLGIGDLKSVRQEQTKIPHPFVGYPEVKSKEGLNLTHVVVLSPFTDVVQDPSNETDEGLITESCHSRYLIDPENGKRATEIVFARTLHLKDGDVKYATVKSPSLRAQLIFKYNTKTKGLDVDKRYQLLDEKQVSRLKKTFQQIVMPQQFGAELRAERFYSDAAKRRRQR